MQTDAPLDPRDLVLHRDLAAPRELVWAALTEPTHLARWWGPSGFRTETHTYALRVGGSWRLTMFGPDGRAYHNHAVFDAVDAPSRLVLRYVEEPGTEPARHVTTITLDELGPDRTRITLAMRFPTAEERKEVAERYGAVEGGLQTLARLATLLDERPTTSDVLEIKRVLAAPLPLVWAAWTDATHLARWFHPSSWAITRSELDLRVGGTFFYGMAGPGFPESFALWTFTEVEPTRRLTFETTFADADRNVIPAPFPGPWPRLTTTVTLERHAGIGGGTLMSVTWTPRAATEPELAAFREMRPSMEAGWGETLDSLVGFLAAK